MVNNLPASAGDVKDSGLIPGSGRFPGGGSGGSECNVTLMSIRTEGNKERKMKIFKLYM